MSIPCVDLFDEQTDAFKNDVLQNAVRKHIVVEAAESLGLHSLICLDGDSVTMYRFGDCAPNGTCLKEFGFTVENILKKCGKLIAKN